ncbi:MAG: hypothetical protein M1840_001543 [Geoglossum simile]|nr:MAG: hypothetical protein M1840_001543 [Geoglossum simile]
MAAPDSGLQVVPEPSDRLVWQPSQQLAGHVPSKEHFPGAGVDLSAEGSLRSGFCGGRRRLFVIGLLVACVLAAVVGGAVGGTRHRHNNPQASSLSGTSASGSPSSTERPKSFSAVYKQGDPGSGIGGWDLLSTDDRSFAFDYDHSGKLDHLVFYRPGSGAIFILKNANCTFSPVYRQPAPGEGIGGYDLKSPADLAFAFDYEHSGKLDYIALFRRVYAQNDPGSGIRGFDFRSPRDRAFAFDNNHSGKLDYIATYQPGTGTFWIIKNDNGNFSAVYAQGSPENGIGGYGLTSTANSAFAFDYEHSGKMDYIVLYRPGNGTIWILKHDAVYQQGDPGNGMGVGGFDLSNTADSVFVSDSGSTGKQDYLVFCRSGFGIIWILENSKGKFTAVYGQDNQGSGIGGFDLKGSQDFGFAFDYGQTGKDDYLVLYRPGTGAVFITEGS